MGLFKDLIIDINEFDEEGKGKEKERDYFKQFWNQSDLILIILV